MPSSTSSSSSNRLTAPTLALLAAVVVYAAGVEVVTRRVLDPASKVQIQLAGELSSTLALRAAAPGQPKSVLLIGNSLLEAGVELQQLNQDLGPNWRASRLMIADTGYTDWHFGLLRLLDAGARPEAIALFLTPRVLLRDTVRGSYFAHYLMRSGDLPDVARAAHLHPTEASGLLLARYSLFYGIRVQLRNVILGRLFPELPDLLKGVTTGKPAIFHPQTLRHEAEVRLKDLDNIARRYGSRLVLVLPPMLSDDLGDGNAVVLESGIRTGVGVLEPIVPGELQPSEFSDGFHANRQGAAAYTKRLGSRLRQWLNSEIP